MPEDWDDVLDRWAEDQKLERDLRRRTKEPNQVWWMLGGFALAILYGLLFGLLFVNLSSPPP